MFDLEFQILIGKSHINVTIMINLFQIINCQFVSLILNIKVKFCHHFAIAILKKCEFKSIRNVYSYAFNNTT